jgi:outer membrane autotransporter protein
VGAVDVKAFKTFVVALVGASLAGTGAARAADYIVNSQSELIAAINVANASTDAVNTITLGSDIALSQALPILNPQSGSRLVIEGNGNTIDGQNQQRIFFANTGDIAIRDVTLANANAHGGNGGDNFGGGGGMGAGGALFVRGDLDGYTGASVTLRNVEVVDNAATGGDGGIAWDYSGSRAHPGGGGGLGGDGGSGADGSGNGGQGGGGAFSGQNGNVTTTSSGAQGGGPDGGAGGASGVDGEQGGEFSGGGGGTGANGGDGGFGGGGGGGGYTAGAGGDGGFGGGGGTSGNGGYGGGGGLGGVGGQGGFGAGDGNSGGSDNNRGGGGAGMGGGLFVMEGGTLIVEDGFTVSGNTVTGGRGRPPNIVPRPPNDGEAFGAGLYFQGSGNATFRPSGGQTQTIGDVIADEAGVVANGYTPPAGFTPGTWSLTKDGDGTLELTGDNSYSGGTELNGGTLSVRHDNALGTGTLTAAGGTLDIQDGITVSNDTDLQNDLDVNVDSGETGTHGGTIGETGGSFAITKTGEGTLNLTGTNTFTGPLTVSGGTLGLQNGAAVEDRVAVTVDSGANLNVIDSETIGSLAGAGNVDIAGAQTLTIAAVGASTTFSGVISGAGGLDKYGSTGTLELTGDNTYSGRTYLYEGTLSVGHDNALGSGLLVGSRGVLDIQDGVTIANATNIISGLNLFSINVGNGATGTHAGVIESGTLIKTGGGTLVLSGDNTYAGGGFSGGGTELRAGTLSVGHDNALGTSTLYAKGGSLDIQDGITISNATDLQTGLDINVDAGSSGTHAGVISGTGALEKFGEGTLELTGDNTYSGGTNLTERFIGIVSVGHDNALGTGTLSTIWGTLHLQDGITISNTHQLENRLDVSVDAGELATHAGEIRGEGTLIKTGLGTLVLSGENMNTGWRWVHEGTLQAGAANVFTGGLLLDDDPNSAVDLGDIDQTAEFLWSEGGAVRLGSATLTTNVHDYNHVLGIISGTGGLVFRGTDTGTHDLLADNTYSGGTVLESSILGLGNSNALGTGTLTAIGGTLNLFDGITIANTTDLQDQLNVNVEDGSTGGHAGDIAGAGVLTKVGGGALVLSGDNSYQGGTVLVSGLLSAGHDNALGTGALTVASAGATLDIQNGVAIANATDLQNDLDVNVNGGATGTHAGVISGSGGLTKEGSGALELTGTSTYAGPTTVNHGTLIVNGSIASEVTVNDGGMLMGSGMVGGDAMIMSGGMYAPGNSIGTQTIAGNLMFASGAVLQVEVNAAGAGDKIIVNGTVNLTGAALQVLAANGAYRPKTNYTIIENDGADAVVGQFTSITSSLAFLTPTVFYSAGDGNDVVLQLERTSELCSVATSPNECNVTKPIEKLPTDNDLFLAVLNQTAAGARQAFNALSGEIYATVSGVLADNSRYVRDAVLGRLMQAGHTSGEDGSVALAAAGPKVATLDASAMTLGSGKSAGEDMAAPEPAPLAFWTHAYGAWGRLNGDGNTATADRDLGGFVSGMDAGIGGSWRGGLATGASFSNVSVDARYSSANVESYHLGGYLGGMAGTFALRGGGMWAWSDVDTSRAVTFPGFYERQKASYHADTGQLFGEVAYPTQMMGLALEPYGGLAYVSIDGGNFQESGGPLASLRGSADQDVGYSTLGLRVATTMQWGAMEVVPHVWAAWQHAFDGVTPEASLALAGIGFTVYGVPLAEDTALIDAGLDLALGERTTAGVSYIGQLGDGVTDNGVKGRFTWLF